MKIPEPPPTIKKYFNDDAKKGSASRFMEIMHANVGLTDQKGRYLHWEKLKHLQPPGDLNPKEYWIATKLARNGVLKRLPLIDKQSNLFSFCSPNILQKELHWLDQNAVGSISMDKPITNPHTRDTYLVSSLIEESINSSQLEGASTTRNIAKEMIIQGRKPKDHSEQMIFNNYRAMNTIRNFKDDDLTPSLILHLHEIVTKDTLDDPNKPGKYRDSSDDIHVINATGTEVLHTPPEANQLPDRMQRICDFANDVNEKEFIHPVIKAIILHFMIGYDHPFVDGNGRTARALFYWAMARHGYWLLEFVSISKIIKQAPSKYGLAYLHTETDDNDLTYFLIHQVEVIRKGIASLHEYLERKTHELDQAETLLDNSKIKGKLNHRQLSLLKHALKNPNAIYRIQGHQISHAISYQTARMDLLSMSDKLNLLRKRKAGKGFVFVSPSDLKSRLTNH